MLAELASSLLEFVFETVAVTLWYCIGWVIVTVLTLGSVRCEAHDGEFIWRIKGRDKHGTFLSAISITFIGALACVAVIVFAAYSR